jgi:hypothetical protein
LPGNGIHLVLSMFNLKPFSQIDTINMQASPKALASYPKGQINPSKTHLLLSLGEYPSLHELTQV